MSDVLGISDLCDFLASEEKIPIYFVHLGRGVLIVRRQNTKHIKPHIYLALKDAFRHFSNLTNSALPEGQV